MKKIISAGLLSLISIAAVQAQDGTVKDMKATASKEVKSNEKDGWKRGGIFSLNINQGTLSNWAAGGEQNTLGINALFNYGINFRKGKNTWDNYFDLAIGFQNATSFGRFRKTDDRIDITTKYGRQLTKKLYYGLLVNFNSQSMPGYDYTTTPNTKISNFLTPGKLLLSPGFDFRPNSDFSLFVSPATVRWIFKSDKSFYALNKFGVDSAKKSYTEIGAYLTAKYTKAFTRWATYTGRLDLFSNYRHNPGNVDVLFNNLLTMKFNKWLATNLSVDILYDDDILKKTQLKEILGIGITIALK
ncbi:MAG: DUF3078 domain-containing protein [Ferruginibacter sp.]